jgi:predicted ATPase
MGHTLVISGDFPEARLHYDHALALYDPGKHRPLAMRFGQDVGVASLALRSWCSWLLGYPDAALRDADRAISDAREIGQAASLMLPLCATSVSRILCGDYTAAIAQSDEAIALAEKKGAAMWSAWGILNRGCVLALTGKGAEATNVLTSALGAWRSTGASVYRPWFLSHLAKAYASIRQTDEGWRCIAEAVTAIDATQERWCEAEVNRISGEIALLPPEPDVAKGRVYFERALSIARAQQAKSWELRASMSLARLWRHQGKVQQARELLAPVYGWFTEGFDTLDLKEAKALLEELV